MYFAIKGAAMLADIFLWFDLSVFLYGYYLMMFFLKLEIVNDIVWVIQFVLVLRF